MRLRTVGLLALVGGASLLGAGCGADEGRKGSPGARTADSTRGGTAAKRAGKTENRYDNSVDSCPFWDAEEHSWTDMGARDDGLSCATAVNVWRAFRNGDRQLPSGFECAPTKGAPHLARCESRGVARSGFRVFPTPPPKQGPRNTVLDRPGRTALGTAVAAGNSRLRMAPGASYVARYGGIDWALVTLEVQEGRSWLELPDGPQLMLRSSGGGWTNAGDRGDCLVPPELLDVWKLPAPPAEKCS
jgi:hypothetical protein